MLTPLTESKEPRDMMGNKFIVGDKVARPHILNSSPYIGIEEVTNIIKEKIYLNESKVAINYPGRLLIVTNLI